MSDAPDTKTFLFQVIDAFVQEGRQLWRELRGKEPYPGAWARRDNGPTGGQG